MNFARLCLLVLLAVLLPLRGALAQSLPCPGGHGPHAAQAPKVRASVEAGVHAQGQPHQHRQVAPGPGAAADAHHAPGQVHGHFHGHAGGELQGDTQAGAGDPGHCSACASCCPGVPGASPMAAAAPPLQAGSLKFPDGSSPVPSVVLDGQDPPPRRA